MSDLFSNIDRTPINRIRQPFLDFFRIEASGGIVLLFCTIIALILANSPFSDPYAAFWNTPISLAVGSFRLNHSLGYWINDALMTIFFFVVGLEIKREVVEGELKTFKAAVLPVVAALGGMIMPAIIYTVILGGRPGGQGWGIPMATDIAFVVGFLALFGKRVPHGLKIFILSLAIADDIGAVVVIAIFYNSGISFLALSLGLAGFGVTALLNRLGVRRVPIYLFVGSLIWLAFLFSGIHPTVAGVLLGLLTPASAWIGSATLRDALSSWVVDPKNVAQINELIFIARETVSPLKRLEVALHPWVAFFIIPLFALANAGIHIVPGAFLSPVAISVALGLFLGKAIGISLFSWFAVKLMGLHLPIGINWPVIIGSGLLAGIGFTMSMFIASLALEGSLLIEGKTGIILGSAISALLGLVILHLTLPKPKPFYHRDR